MKNSHKKYYTETIDSRFLCAGKIIQILNFPSVLGFTSAKLEGLVTVDCGAKRKSQALNENLACCYIV